MLPMMNPNIVVELPRSAMTPAERSRGRFMRAPDGHDAGAPPAQADAGDAPAPEGSEDAGNETDGGEDTSILGGAGGGGAEGGEGQEGAADASEAGEGGDADAAAGLPEKYELTAPEGFEAIDAEMVEAADPILRDLKLSNEDAQKLMPLAGQLVQRANERAQQGIATQAATQRKEWADAFEADPAIGGARKAETLQNAARAFDHYGVKPGEGLRQLLDESGLGNHPDLIRFVSNVGRDLGEASFERGDPVTAPKTPERVLYGEAFQPQK